MALPGLRELLEGPIVGLKDHGTHPQLTGFCETLGLPPPNAEGSKRERMQASYDAVDDAQLSAVAERFLRSFPPNAVLRNRIEELIWAEVPSPEIPKRFRRELANSLEAEDLWLNGTHFEKLLERLWVIDDDPFASFFSDKPSELRAEIQQHVFRNPDDWSVDYLFERLGAYDCSDRRFGLFLEGLASADVRPDVGAQQRFAERVNQSLKPCGVELREVGSDGGYPVFNVISARKRVDARAKNLIFASQSKPDLRFCDAVNNDIEIVSNVDRVLVYEKPISPEGLRWKDLQDWWADREQLGDDAAKKTLYKRLLDILPSNSPPQRLLFKSYFTRFGQAIPLLPALLPEVWLHWDPKTVKERGPDALLRFRMDFLMLLPHNVRVVIEVDGKHHYADQNGLANAASYAAMLNADRDLRLAGYDVYRFGAHELSEAAGHVAAVEFFERLFGLHKVAFPAMPPSKDEPPTPKSF